MRPDQIQNKTVIVAPLDWGMGHATRCIPILRKLIANNCTPIFAGVQIQINLIEKDFPELKCEKIRGYNITLDSMSSTYLQMLKQYRKMKKVARDEQFLAEELADKHRADVIISDNRFGFYSKRCTNVFLTHQLNPQVPFFRKKVAKVIRQQLSNFNYCWIPDNEENPICGHLLNSESPVPINFIGHLSRFQARKMERERDLLVIVSGPEPERSRFQKKIIGLLDKTQLNFKIVTPNPNETEHQNVCVNPSSQELEQLINSSDLVVSRAGYTTIMELLVMNKSAVCIPTKGQYEQEYLAQTIQHPLLKFMEEKALEQFIKNLKSSN
jgi:spore coat polysaccharide biosynthesis predicted glycosyltransferase SpsG